MAARYTWKFCPKTKTAVKKLQEKLTEEERQSRNKWLEEFKQEYKDNEFGMSLHSLLVSSARARDKREAAEGSYQVPKHVNPAFVYSDAIEAEPISRFEYMLEEGCKKPVYFKILAQRLSACTVAKICRHMFETEDLKLDEVECFFVHFFPTYLTRAYSWFSLDVMVKAYEAYPLPFRSLLQVLLRDTAISNTMINDFVLTLNPAGKYEFMSTVIDMELTEEEFIRCMISITSAYKGAEKTIRLQNYIYNTLLTLATLCLSDWNYGRLLLAYLQSLTLGEINFDIRTVERLIETHRSPFKRPCMSMFREAIKALDEAAIPPNPT